MPLEFHQVDAFTDQPFSGNPAMGLSYGSPSELEAVLA